MIRQLQVLPAASPLSPPDSARGTVLSLAAQTRYQADSLGPYVFKPIATTDGRVLRALTLPRDGSLTQTWPEDMLAPRPDFEDTLATTALLMQAQSRIADLASLGADFSWHPFTVNEEGYEVEAYAQHVGYTAACPFQIHWLASARQWQIMGGKFRQQQGPDTVEFTVPTAEFPLAAGHIGLQFVLSAGPASGDGAVYHWITAATWQALPVNNSGTSTLAPIDGNGAATSAGTLFMPVFAVTSNPVRSWPIQLQVPSEPGPYVPNLIVSGPSGTLLRS